MSVLFLDEFKETGSPFRLSQLIIFEAKSLPREGETLRLLILIAVACHRLIS